MLIRYLNVCLLTQCLGAYVPLCGEGGNVVSKNRKNITIKYRRLGGHAQLVEK